MCCIAEFVSKREHDEIVIDTQDKSYRIRTVKELKAWAKVIKAAAVDNGTSLNEQQLTKDNVPTIVEKCVSFVYAHGEKIMICIFKYYIIYIYTINLYLHNKK